MKPETIFELYKAVENKEIVSAKNKDGRIFRLFIATNGRLCYFAKGRSRSGYVIDDSLFLTFVSFKGLPQDKTGEAKLKSEYRDIAKFKRMAQEATFTNSFIESCKKLPDFETWKKDLVSNNFGTPCDPRLKNLFELGVTTGNKIEGKVISIKRISKQYPHYAQRLRDAIKNKNAVGTICYTVPFAGYEMSISVEQKEDGIVGFLSLEYKGCGNGYYYLLINDENFIGYDVD